MHPLINTATKAARHAGNVIMRHLDQLERLTIETKGRNDFVTEVDRQAENEILKIIQVAYPDHGILAEESGRKPGNDYQWIIDPLDGTTNYLHGFPQFAVSIAIEHRGRIEHAVVFDPLRNELFVASRGGGAQLNERRMRVSRVANLEFALLGTGFPFRTEQHLEAWINSFRALLTHSSGIRRAGAAALDLAYVACSRLDGFWEIGLNAWDIAAGTLLIEEAGGLVGDFAGAGEFLNTGNIVAGNPQIYAKILPLIQANMPTDLKR